MVGQSRRQQWPDPLLRPRISAYRPSWVVRCLLPRQGLLGSTVSGFPAGVGAETPACSRADRCQVCWGGWCFSQGWAWPCEQSFLPGRPSLRGPGRPPRSNTASAEAKTSSVSALRLVQLCRAPSVRAGPSGPFGGHHRWLFQQQSARSLGGRQGLRTGEPAAPGQVPAGSVRRAVLPAEPSRALWELVHRPPRWAGLEPGAQGGSPAEGEPAWAERGDEALASGSCGHVTSVRSGGWCLERGHAALQGSAGAPTV